MLLITHHKSLTNIIIFMQSKKCQYFWSTKNNDWKQRIKHVVGKYIYEYKSANSERFKLNGAVIDILNLICRRQILFWLRHWTWTSLVCWSWPLHKWHSFIPNLSPQLLVHRSRKWSLPFGNLGRFTNRNRSMKNQCPTNLNIFMIHSFPCQ